MLYKRIFTESEQNDAIAIAYFIVNKKDFTVFENFVIKKMLMKYKMPPSYSTATIRIPGIPETVVQIQWTLAAIGATPQFSKNVIDDLLFFIRKKRLTPYIQINPIWASGIKSVGTKDDHDYALYR